MCAEFGLLTFLGNADYSSVLPGSVSFSATVLRGTTGLLVNLPSQAFN